jgi:hypothetical protein
LVVEARFEWILMRFGRSSWVWTCRSPLLLVGEVGVVDVCWWAGRGFVSGSCVGE